MGTGTVESWIVSGVVFLFCAWALIAIIRADSRVKFIRLFKVSPKAKSKALIRMAIYRAVKDGREEKDFILKRIINIEQTLFKQEPDTFGLLQKDLDGLYDDFKEIGAVLRSEEKIAKRFYWDVKSVMESESLTAKDYQVETLEAPEADKEETVAQKITPRSL